MRPAAVGGALRSAVLIRYQPRYREGDASRGPTGPARARGRGDRVIATATADGLAALHMSAYGTKELR